MEGYYWGIHYSRQSEKFEDIILENFTPSWDSIEEEPDEFDLKMLKAIESDPECREFTSEKNIN